MSTMTDLTNRLCLLIDDLRVLTQAVTAFVKERTRPTEAAWKAAADKCKPAKIKPTHLPEDE